MQGTDTARLKRARPKCDIVTLEAVASDEEPLPTRIFIVPALFVFVLAAVALVLQLVDECDVRLTKEAHRLAGDESSFKQTSRLRRLRALGSVGRLRRGSKSSKTLPTGEAVGNKLVVGAAEATTGKAAGETDPGARPGEFEA